MGAIASQTTSLTIVYSTVYSGADQSKHQSSASLAFVWGIHRGPVNSSHKWPVTRKIFPFDDVIMFRSKSGPSSIWIVDVLCAIHDNVITSNRVPHCCHFVRESTGQRWFPSQSTSDVDLRCFLCCQPEQTLEQAVERQVHSDVLMSIWCHCNDLVIVYPDRNVPVK